MLGEHKLGLSVIFGRIERDAINRRGARVPGRRRMEFPRQASICQEGLRTPSQRQQEAESSPRHPSTTAQCRHNAFNALFIPPAEESEAIRAHQRNKFELSSTPDRAEAYKIYLPTRAALFSNQPYSTRDNCITSHCALPHSPFRPLSAPLDPSSPHALIVCIFYR